MAPPGVVQCTIRASTHGRSGCLLCLYTLGLDKDISLILVETLCFLHFQKVSILYQVPLNVVPKCSKKCFHVLIFILQSRLL